MRKIIHPSLLSLLLANLAVIIMAVINKWQIEDTLWIYWLQSLIIGLFQAIKMAALRQFSTEGMAFNNRPMPPTQASKTKIIAFFLFHYGFFHFIYAIFLAQFFHIDAWKTAIPAVGEFFINHGLSFLLNRQADKNRAPNLGRLVFFPYIRIESSHLILMAEALLPPSAALLIFSLLLKTAADAFMHLAEHRLPISKAATE